MTYYLTANLYFFSLVVRADKKLTVIFNRLCKLLPEVFMSCLMFTKANLNDLEISGNITLSSVSGFFSYNLDWGYLVGIHTNEWVFIYIMNVHYILYIFLHIHMSLLVHWTPMCFLSKSFLLMVGLGTPSHCYQHWDHIEAYCRI